MKRGPKGPLPPIWRPAPDRILSVTDRAKMVKVPHKNPPNNTYEMHWKFGRYVCQLQRLVFNYDSNIGSSRGLRRFIDLESKKFVDSHPHIAVYFKERNGQTPRLVANYLNGMSRIIAVPDHDSQAIWEWIERLKNESGRQWRSERLHQPWITTTPSIQGTWTPFMFKPPIDINEQSYIDENS